ncbi:MAG: hypothetical protein H8D69_00545 [Chloroflexi bacterium]|nr:hypothetical protein [Chloroflexota bacterium]
MVKTKGVTLVALATLLAGFVASCSSADVPSIDDIPSPGNTITVLTEDDPPGLPSSPVSKEQATAES